MKRFARFLLLCVIAALFSACETIPDKVDLNDDAILAPITPQIIDQVRKEQGGGYLDFLKEITYFISVNVDLVYSRAGASSLHVGNLGTIEPGKGDGLGSGSEEFKGRKDPSNKILTLREGFSVSNLNRISINDQGKLFDITDGGDLLIEYPGYQLKLGFVLNPEKTKYELEYVLETTEEETEEQVFLALTGTRPHLLIYCLVGAIRIEMDPKPDSPPKSTSAVGGQNTPIVPNTPQPDIKSPVPKPLAPETPQPPAVPRAPEPAPLLAETPPPPAEPPAPETLQPLAEPPVADASPPEPLVVETQPPPAEPRIPEPSPVEPSVVETPQPPAEPRIPEPSPPEPLVVETPQPPVEPPQPPVVPRAPEPAPLLAETPLPPAEPRVVESARPDLPAVANVPEPSSVALVPAPMSPPAPLTPLESPRVPVILPLDQESDYSANPRIGEVVLLMGGSAPTVRNVSTASVTGVSGNHYTIQVGAFRDQENAAAAYAALERGGFTPLYECHKDVTRVVIPAVDQKDLARTRERIKALGLGEPYVRQ
ncbi:MAG: SPOR domain-containing protein [Treponema sp.]|jgi:hypothetical protein|nr:SPOR domain-containing protein [Treponema sp.]